MTLQGSMRSRQTVKVDIGDIGRNKP